jgi:hypothetical protein
VMRPPRQRYVLNSTAKRVHAARELVRAKAANDIEQLCSTRDQARWLVKCSVKCTRMSSWCPEAHHTPRVLVEFEWSVIVITCTSPHAIVAWHPLLSFISHYVWLQQQLSIRR